MIEREVKLTTWPGFSLPDLDEVVEGVRARRCETVDLDATYYDTSDLRLGRRGITLRHRRRGARQTWTLKLPQEQSGLADGVARDEIDVAGPPDPVPAELALLVAAHVRTAGLVKVARLVTVRRRTAVEGPDGEALAEIDDDEVSVMDGGRVAARFRELEVEVAPDAVPDVAEALVARLRAAGAELSGPAPKVAQALGPRFFEPPEAAVGPLPAAPTAADVVTAAIRSAVGRILDHHAPAVLGHDPEGVHQMRVGARHLRSDLRTFRPLLDAARTDPLRDELQWLGQVLGEVRDPDVLGERLRAGVERHLDPSDASAATAVLARLDADRTAAVERLHEALGSDRYRALLEALVALGDAPALTAEAERPATEVLAGLVRKPWRRLRREVRALAPDAPDEELHEIRKRAKQVRYAAEAVEAALSEPARRLAKDAKAVQTVLGDHQDTVVTEEWLRQAAADPETAPAEAFVLGALVAGERHDRSRLRAEWPAAWARADDRERTEWLR